MPPLALASGPNPVGQQITVGHNVDYVPNFYLLVSFTAYTVCKANHLYLFRGLEHTTTKTKSSMLQRDVCDENY